ncbi:hypothetical protein CSP5_0953 [Cuniculiplasma divulgatum]|jgi:hypothetical protein|uniref:Uncharacterized protein n=1 Tax=Cuniculiplasma divulgatum TaxID=1673428 RepID=A0A1N5UGD2_9ARCH|nr:MAG: hypothetical protein AMDU5_GPLC00001G0174 [Thermoplasmatales archaeon Gpl]SIM59802.1 hypothetical protein CSP5_0953 [Cuniculiplasma divulgatum]SJK84791.1 hypothetical protein CPM_0949 [Cuniculiplasma divulgatum]
MKMPNAKQVVTILIVIIFLGAGVSFLAALI